MEQPSSEESNIPSPTHQFASFDEILNKTGGISQFSLPASYTKVNLPEIVSNGDQPCEERNCEESLPNINSLPPLFSGDVIPVDKQGNFISTLPPDPIFSLLIDPREKEENDKKNDDQLQSQQLNIESIIVEEVFESSNNGSLDHILHKESTTSNFVDQIKPSEFINDKKHNKKSKKKLLDTQENNKKNILETEMQELLDKKESNLNHFMLRNILKNISKDNVEEIEDSFLMKFISQISEKLKINITGQNMNLVNC